MVCVYINIYFLKRHTIQEVMPLNMFFFSKSIFYTGDVQHFQYLSSVQLFHKILLSVGINSVFYSGFFTARELRYFLPSPIKYLNLMSKLFKDNIICHSASSNQRTWVALFHLSAHVLLLQQHVKMKSSVVQKRLKGLTIFFNTKVKAELPTYNQKMFGVWVWFFFSPESIFAAKSNLFCELS